MANLKDGNPDKEIEDSLYTTHPQAI